MRRFNDKFLCIVVADDEAAAAYLINLEKYVNAEAKLNIHHNLLKHLHH